MKLKAPICKKQEKIGRVAVQNDCYEFVLMPTTKKRFTRKHYCASKEQALYEATGMMYAMYFEHKHPRLEIYKNGKMIHHMN